MAFKNDAKDLWDDIRKAISRGMERLGDWIWMKIPPDPQPAVKPAKRVRTVIQGPKKGVRKK